MDNKIFAQNLNRLIVENNKSQKEVAEAIGVLPQTLNTWCKGKAYPRPDKVQLLADYFQVRKSTLIEESAQQERINLYAQKFAQLNEINQNRIMERIDTLIEEQEGDKQ